MSVSHVSVIAMMLKGPDTARKFLISEMFFGILLLFICSIVKYCEPSARRKVSTLPRSKYRHLSTGRNTKSEFSASSSFEPAVRYQRYRTAPCRLESDRPHLKSSPFLIMLGLSPAFVPYFTNTRPPKVQAEERFLSFSLFLASKKSRDADRVKCSEMKNSDFCPEGGFRAFLAP